MEDSNKNDNCEKTDYKPEVNSDEQKVDKESQNMTEGKVLGSVGSDVEFLEDSESVDDGLTYDYIILDDDDDDDNAEVSQSKKEVDTDTGVDLVQVKKEDSVETYDDGPIYQEIVLKEVSVKIEKIDIEECILQNAKLTTNEIECLKKEPTEIVKSDDDLNKPKQLPEAENTSTKSNAGEKNLDNTLVLTVDESELGEMSLEKEVKSNGVNEQPSLKTDVPKASPESKESTEKKVGDDAKAQNENSNKESVNEPICRKESSAMVVDNEKKEHKKVSSKTEKKKDKVDASEKVSKSRVIWVSNLKRATKASDLKQHINKFGKVVTTKIVTDGQRCFGYVVMDSYKDAVNCIKNLNETDYDNVKITLSTTKPLVQNPNKPDEKDKKTNERKEEERKKDRRPSSNHSKDDKSKPNTKGKPADKSNKRYRSVSNDPLTTKFDDKKVSRSRSKDFDMKKEFIRERMEKERLKRKLELEMKRSNDEKNRLREQERKQREMERKLDMERKKLQQEKEKLERERRDLLQLEAEKRKIEKEKLDLMRQKIEIEKSLREPKRKNSPVDSRKSIKKQRTEIDNRNYNKFNSNRRNIDQPQRKLSPRFSTNPRSKEKKPPQATPSFYVSKKESKSHNQPRKEEKNFQRIPPPPPKLNLEYENPRRKQMDENVRYYARKPSESPPYHKMDYPDKHKPYSAPSRRDERPVGKMDPYGQASSRDQRITWSSPSPVAESWKTNTNSGMVPSGNMMVSRYHNSNSNFSAGYGSSRYPTSPAFFNSQTSNISSTEPKSYYFNHSRKY